MANTRLTLQGKLEEILGSRNVYYNPPESQKMNFPCIVYSLSFIQDIHADNMNYLDYTTYKITVISKNPDHSACKKIHQLPMTKFSTRFVKNGFYHEVYILNQKETQICQS
jgi:hypothetical protein